METDVYNEKPARRARRAWRDVALLAGVGLVAFWAGVGAERLAATEPWLGTDAVGSLRWIFSLGGIAVVSTLLLLLRSRRDLRPGTTPKARPPAPSSALVDERLQHLLEHLPVGVYRTTPDGRILEANPAMAELLGCPNVEALLQRPVQSFYCEADDRTRHLNMLAREAGQGAEFRMCRADGQVVWVRDFPRTVWTDDGGVRYYDGVLIDITAQKKFENQLVSARDKAEDLARLKSTFIANISHEIRTPLTGIIGFATVLRDEVEEPQRELIQLIKHSGERLLETLNSILDFARLEANALEIDLGDMDVVEGVEDALMLFRPIAAHKGLVLELDVQDRPLHARLDRTLLHRILNNLLSNALKFTDEGAIRVSVGATEDHVHLRVSDTGIGIDDDFLPHLFQEFKQESAGLSRSHQGSGLGLAITKRLVEAMHGAITVETRKGEGSVFSLVFPRLIAEDVSEINTKPPA